MWKRDANCTYQGFSFTLLLQSFGTWSRTSVVGFRVQELLSTAKEEHRTMIQSKLMKSVNNSSWSLQRRKILFFTQASSVITVKLLTVKCTPKQIFTNLYPSPFPSPHQGGATWGRMPVRRRGVKGTGRSGQSPSHSGGGPALCSRARLDKEGARSRFELFCHDTLVGMRTWGRC